MSMADVIQWARTAQRSGALKVTEGRGKEIEIVFRDGRIILSATNDEREHWREYVTFNGYCTREDVEDAFRIKEVTGASVASILVHERKITEEQALSTLSEKTIEDVCDVFLWPDGDFSFDPKLPPIRTSLTINLDPIHIVCEGIRRAELWSRMSATIHPSSLFERTNLPFDHSGNWEDARMARHVWTYLQEDLSIRDLSDRLPFSRYKIHRAIAELIQRGFVQPCEVTNIGDREKRVQKKIEEARRAATAERWTESIEIIQGLVAANPGRPELVEELVDVMRGFEHAVYQHNFTKDDVPVITIGPDALARLNIHPSEAFLLSRIDGRLRVGDILRISPTSEFDGLRAIKRLLTAKVIDFPFRSATRTEDLPVRTGR